MDRHAAAGPEGTDAPRLPCWGRRGGSGGTGGARPSLTRQVARLGLNIGLMFFSLVCCCCFAPNGPRQRPPRTNVSLCRALDPSAAGVWVPALPDGRGKRLNPDREPERHTGSGAGRVPIFQTALSPNGPHWRVHVSQAEATGHSAPHGAPGVLTLCCLGAPQTRPPLGSSLGGCHRVCSQAPGLRGPPSQTLPVTLSSPRHCPSVVGAQ